MASLVADRSDITGKLRRTGSLASKRIGKASQKASQSHSDPYITLGFSSLSTTYEAKISWFGTARGRVVMRGIGCYSTAPAACLWRAEACRNNDRRRQFFGHAIQRDYTLWRVECESGWTAGAGVEGEIISNWTWKAEYLHADLGSINVSAPGGTAFLPADAVAVHARFTANILRVGVNLRFH